MKEYLVQFIITELYETTVEAESEADAIHQIWEQEDPTDGADLLDSNRSRITAKLLK
jgi:hypothetical protein